MVVLLFCKDAKSFQSQYDGLMQWMDENLDHLSDPAPPSDNPNKLDKQIQDQKVSVDVWMCLYGCGCACMDVDVLVWMCGCGCACMDVWMCDLLFDTSCMLPLQDFVASIHSKQPELEKALECGRDILEMAHPRASPVVQAMMHDLDLKWSKLKTTAGKRSEELSGGIIIILLLSLLYCINSGPYVLYVLTVKCLH